MVSTVLSVFVIVISLAAALFAWYQARLLERQIQLQAIMDLDREWRSSGMQRQRASCWTKEGHADQETIENVLEFLEKVSSFEERNIIETGLVWDTLGFYLVRYHRYCRNVIEILRNHWTLKPDATLYQDLEKLSSKLLHEEAKERHVTEEWVQSELDDEQLRRKFIESEKASLS